MYKYVLKRLLLMIPIILGVSIIVFVLVNMTPGDPGTIILGGNAEQEQIDALNEELGYNDPLPVRYFNYMKGVLRFDFGESYLTKQPVAQELAKKIPISFTIAFVAIAASLLIGVPIGILSAVKQYSLLDTIPTGIAMVLAAAPSFWVGMMLLLFFSVRLGWLPSFGMTEPGWLILPTLTLAAMYGATLMRFTRSSMLETIRQDYVRTARAKGAAERTIIWKHELKNALIPVITAAGNSLGGLLGGAIVTETLFSIPGLGTYIVEAIKVKDLPIVMGGTIALSVLMATVMLLVDISYALVDPVVRAKYSGK